MILLSGRLAVRLLFIHAPFSDFYLLTGVQSYLIQDILWYRTIYTFNTFTLHLSNCSYPYPLLTSMNFPSNETTCSQASWTDVSLPQCRLAYCKQQPWIMWVMRLYLHRSENSLMHVRDMPHSCTVLGCFDLFASTSSVLCPLCMFVQMSACWSCTHVHKHTHTNI